MLPEGPGGGGEKNQEEAPPRTKFVNKGKDKSTPTRKRGSRIKKGRSR